MDYPMLNITAQTVLPSFAWKWRQKTALTHQ